VFATVASAVGAHAPCTGRVSDTTSVGVRPTMLRCSAARASIRAAISCSVRSTTTRHPPGAVDTGAGVAGVRRAASAAAWSRAALPHPATAAAHRATATKIDPARMTRHGARPISSCGQRGVRTRFGRTRVRIRRARPGSLRAP
jgi:hypothetical protein